MTDRPEDLVLVYLRRLDEKLDRVIDDVQDLKHRMTAMEKTVAALYGEIAGIRGDYAGLQHRMDRMDARLDRIERRFDLTEAAR